MGQAGNFRGRHYTEWVETVKALKRNAQYDDALILLEGLMTAVEAEFAAERLAPAPWYFEQAAIIYRKQKNPDSEVAVLERYLRIDPSNPHPEMAARLAKARRLSLEST